MIDVKIEHTTPIINMLEHFQATITIIFPMTTLRSIIAALTALAVVWLMQANTRHAGFGNPVRIVRFIQRASMAFLAGMLMIVAFLPFIEQGSGQYQDVMTVLATTPLLVMLICSIIVGRLTQSHDDPEKVHIQQRM